MEGPSCFMSAEVRLLIWRGGGGGRESEGQTADTARKKTGETVDRRQNNGVSVGYYLYFPRHSCGINRIALIWL